MLEPFTHVLDLEHLLLGVELERHVRRDVVREPSGLFDPGQRRKHFRRDLAIEFDVLLELRRHGPREHIHLTLIVLLDVLVRGDFRGEVLPGDELLDAGALDAFYQHLHRAVGELQELQDRRNGSEAIQVLRARVIHIGLFLRDEQDLFASAHRLVERQNRFLASDE